MSFVCLSVLLLPVGMRMSGVWVKFKRKLYNRIMFYEIYSRIATKFNFQLEQHKRSIQFFSVKWSKYMENFLWRGLWIKLCVFWIFKDKSVLGSGRLCALENYRGMSGVYTAMNWIEGFLLSELLSKWENNSISPISLLTQKIEIYYS